jgi:hypothetical protein
MLDEFIIAIQTRLTGDAGLTAVVPASRIGNHIKDDATFPHIDWRLEGVVDGEDKTAESYQGNLIIEVFSEYRGDLECYQIQALIRSALATRLTVTGADNFLLRFGSIEVSTEGDNRTRQATITYPFMIGES